MIPLSRPLIGEAERMAVAQVLDSGQLAAGPEVDAFESEFAVHHEVRHAVAVSNGTVALHLGLWALGIGPGDEVVLPSFNFVATANAVRIVGATPVFADIDPETFCLSPVTVRPRLSSRTAAVIQVHLYGQPASLAGMIELCGRLGIALIEDAAQAHGAKWKGKPVGGFGQVGTFSFYPTKNMTTGEGGMVTTNSDDVAKSLRLLRNHGMQRHLSEMVGTNGRMTDIAAAIGRVQLSQLTGWNRRRGSNAQFYDESLTGVTKPQASNDALHVYHQYTIRSRDRAALVDSLNQAGVGYGIYYDPPCHRQKAFGPVMRPLFETESAAEEVVSIPIRQDLTPGELQTVVDAVNRGAESG